MTLRELKKRRKLKTKKRKTKINKNERKKGLSFRIASGRHDVDVFLVSLIIDGLSDAGALVKFFVIDRTKKMLLPTTV